MLQQLTESDASIFAYPSTVEEVTPLVLQVTLCGSSSGAATTDVRSTDLNLDSGYITKSLLKATSVVATKVTIDVFKLTTGVLSMVSTDEGSPQYQDKGSSIFEASF
ncbi:hypothetical protein Hanom_Chr16g01472981 [Helianthus anomalus]